MDGSKRTQAFRTGISLVPVGVLVALLAFNITIFGSDSILGPSQVALLVSAGVCVWLSMWLFKTPWRDFEAAIKGNIGNVTTAIVILFLIGAVSGTWTAGGIIPTLIYYGVQIISPRFFLVTACLICALVSVMTGSSWTTIATIGVALLGIGRAEGFSGGIIAGAIISGAYFGDKVSPLSDTTVLASSVSGAALFPHIRYMLHTTVPSIVIALILFTVLGFTHGGPSAAEIEVYAAALGGTFRITPWLLVVPLLTAVMIARKMPALIVLALSALSAAVFAVIFQPDIIREIGSAAALSHGMTRPIPPGRLMLAGVVETVYDTVSIDTGVAAVNDLVSSRGMLGMLNTVYLIICAMCFGGCMNASGMIRQVASLLVPLTRRRTGLVAATVGTGTLFNGLVSDQYLAIILTADIYKPIYRDRGYDSRLLSRSVEDSATVTSPLYPWSSCGMTQATILGVPTLTYLPYCFFNIISPLMSIFIAAIGYRILRLSPPDTGPRTGPAGGPGPR